MNTSDNPQDTDEAAPAQVPAGEAPAPAGDANEAAAPVDAPPRTAPDDLPEYEPLTPELVEEEAQRGDFMLRWFVVLLALLFGCTEIRDSLTLVRIRTGEYLAGHGWWPPATDVFSYTAAELPWINLSWLGDLLLAGLYRAGGDNTLSIACGLVAAIAFWLLTKVSRPGVSTWWGSACAALGLLAAFPLLTIGPDAFTVLGMAALLFVLARTESDPQSRILWTAPIVLIVWAQLDEHAFLGLMALLAYAVGHTIDAPGDEQSVPVSRMWGCVAAGALGILLHPFHINTLLTAIPLHTVVYPAQAIYASSDQDFHSRWLPLTQPEFWETLSVPTVAGLLVAVVALVTMLLNASRLRWSHAVLWLAINGLAIASGRQLFAAAAVNVVLAALNGQDWYRASFRQSYSVETSELVFSRGGRAVTVLALLALGYLARSGRLMGPEVRRVGIGFDDQLAAHIDSFQDVLKESLDDRPFNFRLEQGDVLIWIGQRPFIDSRLGIYTQGDPPLTEQFRQIRLALRRPAVEDPDLGRSEVWQEAFERYRVTHVLPRLTGEVPDYATLIDLLTAPRWRLVRLGAATAAVYDYQSPEEGVVVFLDAHQGADFAKVAFVDVAVDDVLLNQPVWPRRLTAYDELLTMSSRPISNDVQLARHYSALLAAFRGSVSEDQLVALACLVIRHAWAGLAEHPNAVEGYVALAEAYGYLLELHQLVQRQVGAPVVNLVLAGEMSQLQTALWNAVACRPDDKQLRLSLARVLLTQQRMELALEQMLEFERLNGSLAPIEPDDPNYEQVLEQNRQTVETLQTRVQEARENIQIQLVSGTPQLQVASMAAASGMTAEALRLLEEDATIVIQDPQAQLLQAQLLMEVGRSEEAVNLLENMETSIRQSAPYLFNDWTNTAAIASLASGNYQRAAERWDAQVDQLTRTHLQSVLGLSQQPGIQPGLGIAPLVYSPPFVQDMRAVLRSKVFGDLLLTYPTRWGTAQLQLGLTLLQQGRIPEAIQAFSAVLDYDDETELRPLIAFYLSILTGEPQRLTPPSDDIPITGDMFAPDVEADAAEPPATEDAPSTDASSPDSPVRENLAPAPPRAVRTPETD